MIIIKKYIFLLFACIYYFSFSITNEIYRDRMREFVKEIRNNTSSDKTIISQNGNELYFKNINSSIILYFYDKESNF